MSDNTRLGKGEDGDTVRDIDKGGVKTQVVALDLGGSGTEILVSSGYMPGIDIVHQKVHEGRYFSGGYYNAALVDTGTIDLLVQTSTTNSTHCRVSGYSGGDSLVQIFEAAAFSNAGTAVSISNHNRSSSKVFDGTVTHTPTLTGTGNQLNGTIFIPGGVKAGSSGGSGNFDSEFILAVSQTYLFRITNVSGATKKQSMMLECYQPNL
ncbi:MAG: hypothetical protein WC208_13530 [Gallionella sp.]|jgi:hypothetical protein